MQTEPLKLLTFIPLLLVSCLAHGSTPVVVSRTDDGELGSSGSGFGMVLGSDYDWRAAAVNAAGNVVFASKARNLSIGMGEIDVGAYEYDHGQVQVTRLHDQPGNNVNKVLQSEDLVVAVHADSTIAFMTLSAGSGIGGSGALQLELGDLTLTDSKHHYLAGTSSDAHLVFSARTEPGGQAQILTQSFKYIFSLDLGGYTWQSLGPVATIAAAADRGLESPSISNDGTKVTYRDFTDVYLIVGDAEPVNLTADTGGLCAQPVVTGDGAYVYYVENSSATQRQIVKVRTGDLEKHTITTRPDGGVGDRYSQYPAVSDDGRFVAFRSDATNLADEFAANPAGLFQILLCDTVRNVITPLTPNNTATGAASCYNPAISPDSRYVSFVSNSPVLVSEPNEHDHVFLVDLGEHFDNLPPTVIVPTTIKTNQSDTATILLDATDPDADAVQMCLTSLPDSGQLSIGTDTWFNPGTELTYTPGTGGVFSFTVKAEDEHGMSAMRTVSIEVRDYSNGYVTCETLDKVLRAPYSTSNRVSFSADGRWLAYVETIENNRDLVVKDVLNATRYVLSLSNGGFTKKRPWISADGTMVVFADGTTAFAVPLGDDGPNVAEMRQVNVDGDFNGVSLMTSEDGKRVVYATSTGAYLWEPLSGATPSLIDSTATSAAISGSGKVVACALSEEEIAVWYADANGAFSFTPQPPLISVTDSLTVSELSLSQNGRRLAYQVMGTDTSTGIVVVDVVDDGAETASIPGAANPLISAGGRYLFMLREDNDVVQAYRYDVDTQQEVLLSHTANGTPGDSDSRRGAISPNGRLVFFPSDAALADDAAGRDVFRAEFADEASVAPVADTMVAGTTEDLLDPVDGHSLPPLTIVLAGTDANTYDRDLTFALEQAATGTVTFKYASGLPVLEYTPAPNFFGTDVFGYRCTDIDGLSATGTVTVTVEEVNDIPEWAAPIPAQEIAEEGEIRLDLRPYVSDPDTGNATDPDTLRFALVGDDVPAWATIDQADGHTLVLTPSYEVASNTTPTPEHELAIQVTDSRSDAVPAPDTATVAVQNVDRAPVATLVSLTPETARTVHDLTATPTMSDPDGDTPTAEFRWYRGEALENGLNSATLPAAATAKNETWHVEARAVAFGLASEWIASPAQTIGNAPPEIIQPAPQTTAEDTDVDIAVTVNDVDAGEPLGLVFSQPANGTVALLDQRSTANVFTLRFSPNLDYFSPDGLPETFTIQTSDGTDDSLEASVTVAIEAVNDPPVLIIDDVLRLAPGATATTISVSADAGATIRVMDVDNDPLVEVSLVIAAGLTQGTMIDAEAGIIALDQPLTGSDYPLTYTADEDAVNSDWLTLKAVDPAGAESAPATLLLDLGFHASEIHLKSGWNLVSLPFATGSATFAELLEDPDTGRAAFLGPVWEWIPAIGGYEAAQTAAPFTAYWLYCPVAPPTPVLILGLPTVETSTPVNPGWNLIAPVGPGETGEPVWSPGTVHAWTGAGYAPAVGNRLRRNEGYWIYSHEPEAMGVDVYLPPSAP